MAKISRCDEYLLRRLLGGGGERVGRGHETNILPKLKDTGAYRSFKNNERFAQAQRFALTVTAADSPCKHF